MKKVIFSTITALTVLAGTAQADLANGEYKIGMYKVGGYCMDVQAASTENGANIQMYTCNDTDAQNFSITKNNDGESYSIRNVGSNKLLDVDNYGYGSNVQQYGEDVQDYRSWIITESTQPGGRFYLSLKSNPDVCLSTNIENGNYVGANVEVTSEYCSAYYFSAPVVEEVFSGSYTLQNNRSGKCASVWNDVNGDGALQYNCDVEYGQKKVWNLSHLGNGEYEIRNTVGWKLLDKDLNSSSVQVWEGYPAQNNQKWKIEKLTNGVYFIRSVNNTDDCLSIANDSYDDNASIVVGSCSTGISKYWNLVHQ
ncbi:MAG: RICIN domain-containing protein [Fibrobacterales bacterium]